MWFLLENEDTLAAHYTLLVKDSDKREELKEYMVLDRLRVELTSPDHLDIRLAPKQGATQRRRSCYIVPFFAYPPRHR